MESPVDPMLFLSGLGFLSLVVHQSAITCHFSRVMCVYLSLSGHTLCLLLHRDMPEQVDLINHLLKQPFIKHMFKMECVTLPKQRGEEKASRKMHNPDKGTEMK